MSRHYFGLTCLITFVLFSGCAGLHQQGDFQAIDLNAKLHNGRFVQKVDSFAIILDASQSMTEPYKDRAKFLYAKEIATQFNQTIPDLKMGSALTSFGAVNSPFGTRVVTVQELKDYVKSDLEQAIQSVAWAGGESPLAPAMDLAKEILTPADGRLAVVIISDGKEIGHSPVVSAVQMKETFGKRLCIYTVAVGDDPGGRQLLEEVAATGHCGMSVSADDVVGPQAMADFVEKVFLSLDMDKDSDGDGVMDSVDECPGTPKGVQVDKRGCPLDTDGDGVYDYLDECPGTPKGVKVDDRGCWTLGNVLFDFGKADIKPGSYGYLDEIAAILGQNPSLKVEVQGHTDNVGTAAFNQKLSIKRAQAVVDYLVSKGVAPDRLSISGFGFSRPVASNDTDEGRAKNRRTGFRPIYAK